MLKKIIDIGSSATSSKEENRHIRISNILILILMLLAILLAFPIVYENGWSVVLLLDSVSFLVMASLIWLNYLGKTKLSRVIAALYPPLITMVGSIISKTYLSNSVFVYDFFDARILIVGFSIIPFVLFSYMEKRVMFLIFGVAFLLVVAFDPIHSLFGVGYEIFFGPLPKAYIVSGVYIDLVLFFIAISIYYFLSNINHLLNRNVELVDNLGEKHIELSSLFEEQESLNAILKNNEQLIEEQKTKLLVANEKLSEEVSDKSVELKQSNDELIKHNNDLQQFSNTLSHNLRGPVANLLGLSNLFKIDKSEESRSSIADHIHKSANALDVVIKDLNKIVELRNNLFQIKEKIDVRKEVQSIWQVLDSSVKQSNAKLEIDIQAPIAYGVRSYFHSIMYNLISNAIKYRNETRACVIKVVSAKINNHCTISVEDNGIGVDLEKHGDKMFGMYKRFHTHLEGKGLGLFLTKQQIESMGGSIDVESELNKGTKFTIRFPTVDISEIESQLFYGSDVANIYLDVVNLITTLVWKRMPTPDEFKEVFTNNIEVFSSYNSDKWIIKLELLKEMPEKEKQWILDNAIDTYTNVGVKTIAIIRDLENSNQDFWEEFAKLTAKKSVNVIFVNSFEMAKEKLTNL